MFWVKMGALMMFLGVMMGAFGGHALKEQLSSYSLDVYKTAVMYHLIHALGLFIVAWLTIVSPDKKVAIAGWCMLAGIILFSGSLYVLAITQIKAFGAITPVGGVLFLMSWALLIFIKGGMLL